MTRTLGERMRSLIRVISLRARNGRLRDGFAMVGSSVLFSVQGVRSRVEPDPPGISSVRVRSLGSGSGAPTRKARGRRQKGAARARTPGIVLGIVIRHLLVKTAHAMFGRDAPAETRVDPACWIGLDACDKVINLYFIPPARLGCTAMSADNQN